MNDVVLRDVADRVRLRCPDVDAVETDDTAARWTKAGDGVEQRRLARAAGPDDGDELARFDAEAHLAEDDAIVANDLQVASVDPQTMACRFDAVMRRDGRREVLGRLHGWLRFPRRRGGGIGAGTALPATPKWAVHACTQELPLGWSRLDRRRARTCRGWSWR